MTAMYLFDKFCLGGKLIKYVITLWQTPLICVTLRVKKDFNYCRDNEAMGIRMTAAPSSRKTIQHIESYNMFHTGYQLLWLKIKVWPPELKPRMSDLNKSENVNPAIFQKKNYLGDVFAQPANQMFENILQSCFI